MGVVMTGLRQGLSLGYGALAGWGKALGVAAYVLAGSVVQAQEVVIAALGDSLTQGYGLQQDEGLVPQLDRWLQARGHSVRLINAGVSGDTTAGGLARVGWTMGDDVDAMIVALGGNDLLRGIAPEVSRANLDGILRAAEAADVAVMLVGLRAFNNFGPEYKTAFDAMFPDLAAEYGTLYFSDFLGAISGPNAAGQDGYLPRYIQPDGVHPNAAGVARIVEAIGPTVEALIARVPQS
jgi:acyl-CoA thioesterase I